MYDIKGLEELTKKFEWLTDYATKEFQKVINKYGAKLIRDVKLNTPVDTGQLRRAWQSKTGHLYYQLYSTSSYALYVEYGHRTRSGNVVDGRYMLTKACKNIEKEFCKEIEEVFRKVGL